MTATLPSVKSLKPAVRAFPIGAATPDDVIGQEKKVGQDLQDWSGRDRSNSMPRSVSLWSHVPSHTIVSLKLDFEPQKKGAWPSRPCGDWPTR